MAPHLCIYIQNNKPWLMWLQERCICSSLSILSSCSIPVLLLHYPAGHEKEDTLIRAWSYSRFLTVKREFFLSKVWLIRGQTLGLNLIWPINIFFRKNTQIISVFVILHIIFKKCTISITISAILFFSCYVLGSKWRRKPNQGSHQNLPRVLSLPEWLAAKSWKGMILKMSTLD